MTFDAPRDPRGDALDALVWLTVFALCAICIVAC